MADERVPSAVIPSPRGGRDQEPRPPTRRAGGVTVRSVVIGLAAVVLITVLSQKLDLWRYMTYVTGGAPPAAQTYLLFLLVLFGALLIWLGGRHLALSRSELLVIYLMMLVGGPISNREGIGFLICHPVIPYYYASPENGWAETFHRFLPAWFGPSNPEVVRGFFRGQQPVPWGAWTLPFLAWGGLYFALFATTFCFNALVERQWITRERLTFPLLAIPLELTRSADAAEGPALLRRRGFWLGLAVTLGISSLNNLHRYYPSVPELVLQYPLLPEEGVTPPWTGLGTMDVVINFPLIAVAFILPAEISLSCWFFHFLTRVENVVAVLHTGLPPDVYSSAFPALYAQGSGSMFMLFGLLLWSARKPFREAAFRLLPRRFRRHVPATWEPAADLAGAEGASALSPGAALLGFVAGLLFLAAWLRLAGMSLLTTTWFLAMLFMFLIVLTRVRAETGLGTLLPPMFVNELMFIPLGPGFFHARDLTILQALRPLYRMMGVLWTVQGQLEGFKLAEEAPFSKRAMGGVVALATVVGFTLAFVLALKLFYDYGFINLPIGMRGRGYPGSQGYWSYGSLAEAIGNPGKTDAGALWGMAAGAGICWGTALMRARFLWFPLHPVGFMSAFAWGMHLNWFPFLFGWAAKVACVRYGGLATYRGAIPFFIGLLVGSTLNSGLWGLIGWVVGNPLDV